MNFEKSGFPSLARWGGGIVARGRPPGGVLRCKGAQIQFPALVSFRPFVFLLFWVPMTFERKQNAENEIPPQPPPAAPPKSLAIFSSGPPPSAKGNSSLLKSLRLLNWRGRRLVSSSLRAGSFFGVVSWVFCVFTASPRGGLLPLRALASSLGSPVVQGPAKGSLPAP